MNRGWRRRRLGPLVLPALVLAGVAVFVRQERDENARRAQEDAAEEAAQRAERLQVFARGSFDPVLELCRAGWRDELNVHHEPSALAWTRRSLDGYFLDGTDLRSWRQLRCDANGVRRGPRVAHPLLTPLAEATPETGSESAAADDEAWRLALERLSAAPRDPRELGVELARHPLTGAVISRRWRGVEGGAGASLEPAGTPPFALLIAEPDFPFAPGAAPPPLRSLPRVRWLEQPDAAFDVVERALPAGARIVELTFGEDEIDLTVESPTPAFDGDPPAPYGDMGFDEYGIAEMSWWYPRTEPGFGCPTGESLADVRAGYAAARARVRGPLIRAWYSCSPAYSDGRRGVWHLVDDQTGD
ncbi:MAG TPA: hypothetical protein VGC93_08650 [Thermoanaerobaculia bacterium]